jgi:hypothetical protein
VEESPGATEVFDAIDPDVFRKEHARRPVSIGDVVPLFRDGSPASVAMASDGDGAGATTIVVTGTRPAGVVEIVDQTTVEPDPSPISEWDRVGLNSKEFFGLTARRNRGGRQEDCDQEWKDGPRLNDIVADIEGVEISSDTVTTTVDPPASVTVRGRIEKTGEQTTERLGLRTVFFADEAGTVHLGCRSTYTVGLDRGDVWEFEVEFDEGIERRPRSFDILLDDFRRKVS